MKVGKDLFKINMDKTKYMLSCRNGRPQKKWEDYVKADLVVLGWDGGWWFDIC